MVNTLSLITEKQFRQQVIDLAKLFGWKCYFTWTSIHSPRGIPDLVLCRPPRLILAELKTIKGKVTPHQQEWLDLLEQCPGVETFVWRPPDWDEIVAVLQREVC